MIERVSALMRVGGGISLSSSSSSSTSTTACSSGRSSSSCCSASILTVPSRFTPAATGIGGAVALSSSSLSSFTKQNNNSNNTIHTTPVLLACSAIRSQEHREILGMRKLCEDRRGVVDHLYPKKLIIGAVRVTITQATQLYSNYLNDQLQADIKRDELVREGKLSPDKAVEQEEEWIENEWNHRIQVFPQKLCTAYMKYHAITLVMRLYEEIASRFVSNVMLDKLTLDTFSSAKRRQREQNNNHNIAYFSINDMTREGWYANLIAFLADYSVHQVILAYGYYVYIRQHRLEKRQKRLAATAAANQGKAAADGGGRDDNDNDPFLHPGSLVLSFTKKSTLLALSRIIALAMASVGGALGTMVVPGWGTLAGTNFGDGIAASLTDDFVTDL